MNFMQQIANIDDYTLTGGDKFSQFLVYTNKVCGEVIKVPNIWYNQPLQWQADNQKFHARMAIEIGRKCWNDRDPAWKQWFAKAIRFEKIAADIEKSINNEQKTS